MLIRKDTQMNDYVLLFRGNITATHVDKRYIGGRYQYIQVIGFVLGRKNEARALYGWILRFFFFFLFKF